MATATSPGLNEPVRFPAEVEAERDLRIAARRMEYLRAEGVKLVLPLRVRTERQAREAGLTGPRITLDQKARPTPKAVP